MVSASGSRGSGRHRVLVLAVGGDDLRPAFQEFCFDEEVVMGVKPEDVFRRGEQYLWVGVVPEREEVGDALAFLRR